jgi:hypothetical protein
MYNPPHSGIGSIVLAVIAGVFAGVRGLLRLLGRF